MAAVQMPGQVIGNPTSALPIAPPEMVGGRLQAISRGESIATAVHSELGREDMVLTIDQYSLWYGPKQALFEVTMGVPRHKITALIGPSGCGKSTLLRSVNRMNDLIDSVKISGDM